MYILILLSHWTLGRGAVYPHGLKLEVVFPSSELTLQEMKLKTRGKVHYGGYWEMPDPTDLVPTVAQGRASLRAGPAAAGTTQPSAEPWALGPLSRSAGDSEY